MGLAVIFASGRRSLKLWVYSKERRIFEGEIKLRRGRIFRLLSPALENPLPRRALVKFLRPLEVVVPGGSEPFVGRALSEEGITFREAEMCMPCLHRGRLSFLGDGYILLHGRRSCTECAAEELRRELSFRGYSRKTFRRFLKLLLRYRDFDRVLKILDARVDPTREELSLYDVVEAEAGEGRSVAELDINPEFKRLLLKRGITRLMPVQEAALESGLLAGESLLVVSATASGKTLIGELAGVESALRGKRFLFLVPLVAIANQKYQDFKIYRELGLRVAIRVGMSRVRDREELVVADSDLSRASIIVGTYEGMDVLLRRGRRRELGEVGVVVIDELHMLGEAQRGAEIDGLIARLRRAFPEAQFICLSATVGNAPQIAEHYSLKPVIYTSRPVPLERHLIFLRSEAEKRSAIAKLIKRESAEVSSRGFRGQTIVFTNSRFKSASLAGFLRNRGIRAQSYHAGLTYARRKRIEQAFMHGELEGIVTTAALGAGVDFPASQVVFETLSMGNRWLSVAEFHQMLGRAGRPGYHDRGRVVLLVELGRRHLFSSRESEEEVAFRLLNGSIEGVEVNAEEEEIMEQVLANLCTFPAHAAAEASEGMLCYGGEFRHWVEKLEELGLVSGGKPTKLGRIAASHFLLPGEARMMAENAATPPLELLARLLPFTNAYVSPALKSRLEESYRTRVSAKYFDAVGIIFEEPKQEFQEVLNLVKDEFLACECRAFPYCDHPTEELAKKVVLLRKAGKNSKDIARMLGACKMLVYSGDVFNWLESAVRKLEAMERVYLLMGERGNAKLARELRLGVEMPKGV
ncbi:DEAD/DEAH box helicase [Candidatus Pyrohabitans sp.]